MFTVKVVSPEKVEKAWQSLLGIEDGEDEVHGTGDECELEDGASDDTQLGSRLLRVVVRHSHSPRLRL